MAGQNIQDGYTLKSKIKVGNFPDLNITYRPMLGPLRSLILDQQSQAVVAPVAVRLKALKDAAEVTAQALVEQLVSWDLRDASGVVVPITKDAMLSLDPEQFAAVENRVTGWNRPEEPSQESEEASTEKN